MNLIESAKTIALKSEEMGYIPKEIVIVSAPTGAEIITRNGEKLINLASNSYLGLSTDPKVIEAFVKAAEKFGVGSGGSRWMAGTTSLHVELEEKLAAFKNCEAAGVFSSGFLTNRGTIFALLQPLLLPILQQAEHIMFDLQKIIVFNDELNHASIQDACKTVRKNRFQIVHYKHLSITDLEEKIKKAPIDTKKLIITDGVFSTLGTIADMAGIVKIAKEYGANTMIDDAHGLGVIGNNGRGTIEFCGVESSDIDVHMGTLSKACGEEGGYIAGSRKLITFLKTNASSYIFNTAMPPASCAAAIKSLEIIEQEPYRRIELQNKARFFRDELNGLGFNTLGSVTQIIPIFIGDETKLEKMSMELRENYGILAPAFKFPAAHRGKAIFRLSLTYLLQKTHLEIALDAFAKLGKKYQII